MFLLYCDDLELNLQYLWGMPVFSCCGYPFCCSSLFCADHISHLVSFSFCWRTSLAFLAVKICCWWILSSFVCLKVFILPLKDIFTAYRILFDSFIPSDFNAMLLHHLLTCIIPSEKSAVIFIFVLIHHNMSLLLPNPTFWLLCDSSLHHYG